MLANKECYYYYYYYFPLQDLFYIWSSVHNKRFCNSGIFKISLSKAKFSLDTIAYTKGGQTTKPGFYIFFPMAKTNFFCQREPWPICLPLNMPLFHKYFLNKCVSSTKKNVHKPSAGNSEDLSFLELQVAFLLTVKIFQSDILLNLSATWNSM